jgi:hypothetical protein
MRLPGAGLAGGASWLCMQLVRPDSSRAPLAFPENLYVLGERETQDVDEFILHKTKPSANPGNMIYIA